MRQHPLKVQHTTAIMAEFRNDNGMADCFGRTERRERPFGLLARQSLFTFRRRMKVSFDRRNGRDCFLRTRRASAYMPLACFPCISRRSEVAVLLKRRSTAVPAGRRGAASRFSMPRRDKLRQFLPGNTGAAKTSFVERALSAR